MRTLASIFVGLVAGSIFVLLLYIILRPKGPKKVSLVIQDTAEVEPKAPASSSGYDNLESINGIGPTYARRLNEAGINSFATLAGAAPSKIAEIIGSRARSADIDSWIAQAKGLT